MIGDQDVQPPFQGLPFFLSDPMRTNRVDVVVHPLSRDLNNL